MTDRSTDYGRAAAQGTARPPLDFQDHLKELERQGLLVRVDRPINKDTELHPLVRWQFLGGIPENERKAFIFTNVVDSKGRRYDMPVVVGALAASPRIYAIGMGMRPRCHRRSLEPRHRQSGAAGRRQRAALPGGRGQGRRPETRGSRAPAGSGIDAGLRLRALSHRDALHHARPRQRRAEHGHLSRRAEGERPPRRAHGGAAGRRRRLHPLAQIQRAQRTDADRDRARLRAGRLLHRRAEARGRCG